MSLNQDQTQIVFTLTDGTKLASNFETPKAIPGPQGEPGPKGDTGAQGPKGDPGSSAYQLAQDSGFKGTLNEWLQSLKGDPGAEGPKGEMGLQGTAGKDAPKVTSVDYTDDKLIFNFSDGNNLSAEIPNKFISMYFTTLTIDDSSRKDFDVYNTVDRQHCILLNTSLLSKGSIISSITLKPIFDEIDTKADKTALDAKADKSTLVSNTKIILDELKAKADETDLDEKADKTDLDAKADKTALDAKADKADLDAKADKADLDAKADKDKVLSYKKYNHDLKFQSETGIISSIKPSDRFEPSLEISSPSYDLDDDGDIGSTVYPHDVPIPGWCINNYMKTIVLPIDRFEITNPDMSLHDFYARLKVYVKNYGIDEYTYRKCIAYMTVEDSIYSMQQIEDLDSDEHICIKYTGAIKLMHVGDDHVYPESSFSTIVLSKNILKDPVKLLQDHPSYELALLMRKK